MMKRIQVTFRPEISAASYPITHADWAVTVSVTHALDEIRHV